MKNYFSLYPKWLFSLLIAIPDTHPILVFLIRFIWELPQTILGFVILFLMMLFGMIKRIEFCRGAVVVQCRFRFGGFSIGQYIFGDEKIKADPSTGLFQHEYGHVLQSRKYGIIYLSKFGFPSLVSAIRSRNRSHDKHPVEQDANVRAKQFFEQKISNFQWDNSYNPIDDQIKPEKVNWFDYIPGHFPLAHLLMAFRK
jgi:hypothetical protein